MRFFHAARAMNQFGLAGQIFQRSHGSSSKFSETNHIRHDADNGCDSKSASGAERWIITDLYTVSFSSLCSSKNLRIPLSISVPIILAGETVRCTVPGAPLVFLCFFPHFRHFCALTLNTFIFARSGISSCMLQIISNFSALKDVAQTFITFVRQYMLRWWHLLLSLN